MCLRAPAISRRRKGSWNVCNHLNPQGCSDAGHLLLPAALRTLALGLSNG
jgi:hypothetical protein